MRLGNPRLVELQQHGFFNVTNDRRMFGCPPKSLRVDRFSMTPCGNGWGILTLKFRRGHTILRDVPFVFERGEVTKLMTCKLAFREFETCWPVNLKKIAYMGRAHNP